MKVKEIKKTANVAWSPQGINPVYIAAGTAAQQLDASFSTAAALELYHVDLASGSLSMPVAGSMPSEHRFHKLLWTDHGHDGDHPSGMILGGTDDGKICVIDAATILSGDHELSLLDTLSDHTGPVGALDVNKFQHNLIASGASDSEIFIWDLRNPETPLTPGTKTSPPDQVSCLAWNVQVQHILASSSQTGRVVIWDLRKSEPIIKVGDQSAMFHYKSLAWHPNVATQILIGNEDDRYPVIQMWDLRYATSPMKIFEGHTRGVLALDWCPHDEDLLMSCGKDNKVLCWNPNTEVQNGEIVYELPTSAQWTSDVKWSPRYPGLVSTAAFDGLITVSTLMGGSMQIHQEQQNQISDSFGIQQPSIPSQPTTLLVEPLKKPPKWMRKPCGARFGFGGKLITIDNTTTSQQQLHISQVVTERDFLSRSDALERAIMGGQLVEFCDTKIEQETDPKEKLLWQFLKSNFHDEPRMQFLNLLGYNPQEIAEKITTLLTEKPDAAVGVDAQELASKIEQLKVDAVSLDGGSGPNSIPIETKTPDSDANLLDEPEAEETSTPDLLDVSSGYVVPDSTPANGAATTDVFQTLAGADSAFASQGSDLFDAIAEGTLPPQDQFDDIAAAPEPEPEPVVEVPAVVEEPVVELAPEPKFTIPTDNEMDGLICQALLAGNFDVAVDVCFQNKRFADGLLLAIAGGTDLFVSTQKRYLDQSQSAVSKIIAAIVNRDWRSVVANTAIENWKEALSTLVTYSRAEEFSDLCCFLGERLETESCDYNSALLCYICAGDVEKMTACWAKSSTGENASPIMLQNLIEKMMVLKKSVESNQQPIVNADSHVAIQLSNYASLLSSQGNLQTALVYLSVVDGEGVAVLKDRVYRAHGGSGQSPFQKVDVPTKAPTSLPRTPLQERTPSLNYNQPQSTPPATFQPPQPEPQQQNYYNPADNTAYYNPATTVQPPQPAAIPGVFTPAAPATNHYQPQPPPQPPQPQQTFQPPPPSNRTPTGPPPPGQMYQPQAPAPAVAAAPPPNMFTPQQPQQHAQMFNPGVPSQPSGPPGGGLDSPMKSAPPPNMGPPPSSASIMSMKATKESTQPQQAQQQPMNFYNPAANIPNMQSNVQPDMNGHVMQPHGVPNMPNSTALPPQQTHIPPQPKKMEAPAKAEVIKAPIPQEHAILQQIFDALVEKCRGATRNPQSKRKLDDVRRKLDALYDLLRENGISPNVLASLHRMSEACQQSDYTTGIQLHTQLISTGNFSEISSFMPGLKTLMQISHQLKI
jgi:protein transport protein SEC31